MTKQRNKKASKKAPAEGESIQALVDWAVKTGSVEYITDSKGVTYIWGKKSNG